MSRYCYSPEDGADEGVCPTCLGVTFNFFRGDHDSHSRWTECEDCLEAHEREDNDSQPEAKP